MVRITEELVRKRAEHNEGEIYSLEELSLHQQNIEKIENLDKWCRELKILYLQSNLISKIENVNRLKKLEYLNLALNNIEIIENLENCESLKKLDLTVNFVGILTSIDNLKDLYCFEELYLTGNPCQSFDGYRDFVLASLPQLKYLDGTEVMKSERIAALQAYPRLTDQIKQQQNQWLEKRARERNDAANRKQRRQQQQLHSEAEPGNVQLDEDSFWNEKTPFTPETRWETHEYLEEKKRREKNEPERAPKPERRLFASDGRPYNINEAKIEFSFTDDEAGNRYVLDVVVYKHLDTSLVDCDVQPGYVRILIKGKLLQLALPDEVQPDASTATRSQTTGHLLVLMPKVKAIVTPHQPDKVSKLDKSSDNKKSNARSSGDNDDSHQSVDWKNIVSHDSETGLVLPRRSVLQSTYKSKSQIEIPPNSPDFVDDPSVPALE